MKTPGESILLSVNPLQLEDLAHTEDEIEWSVWRLRNNHSGGPSGIRAEHLIGWLEETRKAEEAAKKAMEEEAEATK